MKLSESNVRLNADNISGDSVNPVFVGAACEKIAGMLKPDISEGTFEAYRIKLEYAAALLAVRDAAAVEIVSSPSEIKADEISIKNNVSLVSISLVIESAIDALLPVLTDRDFSFTAIKWEGQS